MKKMITKSMSRWDILVREYSYYDCAYVIAPHGVDPVIWDFSEPSLRRNTKISMTKPVIQGTSLFNTMRYHNIGLVVNGFMGVYRIIKSLILALKQSAPPSVHGHLPRRHHQGLRNQGSVSSKRPLLGSARWFENAATVRAPCNTSNLIRVILSDTLISC